MTPTSKPMDRSALPGSERTGHCKGGRRLLILKNLLFWGSCLLSLGLIGWLVAALVGSGQ